MGLVPSRLRAVLDKRHKVAVLLACTVQVSTKLTNSFITRVISELFVLLCEMLDDPQQQATDILLQGTMSLVELFNEAVSEIFFAPHNVEASCYIT